MTRLSGQSSTYFQLQVSLTMFSSLVSSPLAFSVVDHGHFLHPLLLSIANYCAGGGKETVRLILMTGFQRVVSEYTLCRRKICHVSILGFEPRSMYAWSTVTSLFKKMRPLYLRFLKLDNTLSLFHVYTAYSHFIFLRCWGM